MFDTHCHLQDERLSGAVDDVVKRAVDAGVTTMLCCGSEESDWARVLALSERFHGTVIPAFGLHPWYVQRKSEKWLATLREFLLKAPSAVGEIGLDHALDNYDPADQEAVFRDQLRLALELHRPVSLHCRKAFGRLREILEGSPGWWYGGAIHSYSGPPDMVPLFEKLGFSISFSCSVTRTHNKRARSSAAVVSSGRLLVETDSPDIPPVDWGDRPNEPANAAVVIKTLAEIRGESVEALAETVHGNAVKVFGGI